MAKLLRSTFFMVAILIAKGIALKCYYCNDFDDTGPLCSTITRRSELMECFHYENYKTYCLSFEGGVLLSRTGIFALRQSSKVGQLRGCLIYTLATAPPTASCYHHEDVRTGTILDGSVLERVDESIMGTQCYCNQTDGCNYNGTRNGSESTASPFYVGSVGSLRPMVALLLILPLGTILKLVA